ncbi:hypothetical protein Hanom_Chr17g01560131 [Helianthus anomalus]
MCFMHPVILPPATTIHHHCHLQPPPQLNIPSIYNTTTTSVTGNLQLRSSSPTTATSSHHHNHHNQLQPLEVPWKGLGKEPVIALIDRVFILAHPASDGRSLTSGGGNSCNPGHPFAVGVTLAKLAAFTVDEKGNETFDTSGALDKLRKAAVVGEDDRSCRFPVTEVVVVLYMKGILSCGGGWRWQWWLWW